ncbi:MAG TPA: hypothetical protein VGE04_10800 [Chloroflexia bacterium]
MSALFSSADEYELVKQAIADFMQSSWATSGLADVTTRELETGSQYLDWSSSRMGKLTALAHVFTREAERMRTRNHIFERSSQKLVRRVEHIIVISVGPEEARQRYMEVLAILKGIKEDCDMACLQFLERKVSYEKLTTHQADLTSATRGLQNEYQRFVNNVARFQFFLDREITAGTRLLRGDNMPGDGQRVG